MTVIQGYGATETGTGSSTRLDDHGLGTVGRPPEGVEMRIAADGEIQFKGPTVFRGYWNDPTATSAAFTADGWYRTGDIGHLDDAGRLILSGRIKDIIVLPNGFNVYPEDIENALRIAGHPRLGGARDAARPDRGGRPRLGRGVGTARAAADAPDPAAVRERIDAAVKAANATLGPNQRIAGWRLWPDEDFPRTHTLKIKRGAGPRVAGRRLAAAGGLTGRVSSGRGSPSPSVSSAVWMPGRPGPCARPAASRSRRPSTRPGGWSWTVPSGRWTATGPVASQACCSVAAAAAASGSGNS